MKEKQKRKTVTTRKNINKISVENKTRTARKKRGIKRDEEMWRYRSENKNDKRESSGNDTMGDGGRKIL